MLPNRAIVTITGKLSKLPGTLAERYVGVAELADTGFTTVEIVLPFGIRSFTSVPYMVTVDCDSTVCEFRQGKIPLLTITDWQPLEHYYM